MACSTREKDLCAPCLQKSTHCYKWHRAPKKHKLVKFVYTRLARSSSVQSFVRKEVGFFFKVQIVNFFNVGIEHLIILSS